jgi:hypothetical protein
MPFGTGLEAFHSPGFSLTELLNPAKKRLLLGWSSSENRIKKGNMEDFA